MIRFARRRLLDRGPEIIAVYKSSASFVSGQVAKMKTVQECRLSGSPSDPQIVTVLHFPPLSLVDHAQSDHSLRGTPLLKCIL